MNVKLCFSIYLITTLDYVITLFKSQFTLNANKMTFKAYLHQYFLPFSTVDRCVLWRILGRKEKVRRSRTRCAPLLLFCLSYMCVVNILLLNVVVVVVVYFTVDKGFTDMISTVNTNDWGDVSVSEWTVYLFFVSSLNARS